MHHSQTLAVSDEICKHQNFSLQYDSHPPFLSFFFACYCHVTDVFMKILDTNPALYFHLQQQKLIEYIRGGRIAEALQFAQQELAPRGEESPEFLSELERTMALLAFESSPSAPPAIAELLSTEQRMKTAGELNAAILESLSQGKDAKLVGLVKLLCWGEAMLDERAEYPRVDLRDGLTPGRGREKEVEMVE